MPTSPDRFAAPEIHELPVMPFVQADNSTLPNGVDTVCVDSGTQPVSRITICWSIGYADVQDANTLALMSKLLMEGTRNHSAAEIADTLEFNGAWVKANYGRHNLMLDVFILNKTASVVLPLVKDIVVNPVFPQDSLERIRETAIAKWKLDQQKVTTRAQQLNLRQLYGINSRAIKDISPSGLCAVSSEDLMNLHQNLMTGKRPTIFAAGDLTSGVMDEIKTIGTAFPSADSTTLKRIIDPMQPLESTIVATDVMPDALQTAIRIGLPTIPVEHHDYYDLKATVFALGGYFSSRLMSNIREEKGYTYGIYASMLPSLEGNNIVIRCETDNSNVTAVITEIDNEIKKLATHPMDTGELEIVRHTIHSGLLGALDSPFSILDGYIVEYLMGIKAEENFTLQQQAAMNISPEKIMEMAEKYLLHTPRAIALAGNPDARPSAIG